MPVGTGKKRSVARAREPALAFTSVRAHNAMHSSSCLLNADLRSKITSYSHVELAQNPALLTDAWLTHAKRVGVDYALRFTDGYMAASNPLREAPPYVAEHADLFEYMLFPPDHSEFDGAPRERAALRQRNRHCRAHSAHFAATRRSHSIYIDAGANEGDTMLKLRNSPMEFGSSLRDRRFDRIVAFEGNERFWCVLSFFFCNVFLLLK